MLFITRSTTLYPPNSASLNFLSSVDLPISNIFCPSSTKHNLNVNDWEKAFIDKLETILAIISRSTPRNER